MAAESTPSSDRAEALRETLVALFALEEHGLAQLPSALSKVAPEDVAAVLVDFSDLEKLRIFHALPTNEARGIVLEGTDRQSEREILEGITDAERDRVFGEMPPDDLVDHLETLPADEQKRVIASLEKDDAKEVAELLQYAPDTAGGMMTTEFISIPSDVTSREALEKIQGNLMQEVIAYVYVVDPDGVLCGVASIRGILKAKPETPVLDYMTTNPVSVDVDTDREEVAAAVDKYNHAALPVVDRLGRLRGIVTFDDVFDAVQEEHSEDMLRMAGTVAINPFYEPVLVGVLKRLPFLLVTMLGGFGIIFVKNLFEKDIPASLLASALGVIPLVIGLSGNVAIVTSTIMVRGLATGDINLARIWRALGKEVLVGTTLGLVLAVVVSLCLGFFGGADYSFQFAWIAAFALSVSVTFAALIGALIPLFCRFTGSIDPAIASGPFVTMLCDLSASFIFLALVFFVLVE